MTTDETGKDCDTADRASIQNHANMLMNRLNQLQNNHSSILALIGASAVGAFAALTTDRATWIAQSPEASGVLLLLISTILVASHLFSLYQMAAVFKCAKVLRNLEQAIDPLPSHQYFSGKMKERNFLHFLSHVTPSWMLLIFPVCLHILNKIDTAQMIGFIALIVVLSGIYYWRLYRSLDLSLLPETGPGPNGFGS